MVEPSATLTEVDDGRTIAAKVGDTIELVLPENATTGYRWASIQQATDSATKRTVTHSELMNWPSPQSAT